MRITSRIAVRITGLIIAAVTCVSCTPFSGGSRPVPIADAIRDMDVDLSKLDVIVASDLLKDTSSQVIRAAAASDLADKIKNIQCYAVDPTDGKTIDHRLRKRNPLLPVFTGPMQLTVQGQYAVGGTFTLAAALSASGTVTRQTQQQQMFPLTLVPLANLPAFYLGQQTTNIQYVALYKEQTANAINQFVSNAMAVTSTLTKVVDNALKDFDADPDTYCKRRDTAAKTSGLIPAR